MAGYEGIFVPYKTTEWEAMISAVRNHSNGSAGMMQTVAGILRKELPWAKNVNAARGGVMGKADKVIAAIRIARHLNRYAAAQIASAAALTKADDVYHGTFGGSAGTQRPREGRYDAGR